MSRRSLPDTMVLSTVDLSQISLFVATREQALEARRRTHVEWSKGLSMEAYLQHDQRLEQLEHARDGRLFDWYVIQYPKYDSLFIEKHPAGSWPRGLTLKLSTSIARAKRE
jgi:hypothetical protein